MKITCVEYIDGTFPDVFEENIMELINDYEAKGWEVKDIKYNVVALKGKLIYSALIIFHIDKDKLV